MPVTLRHLIDRADLRLTVLEPGPPGALERPVTWVHPTELRDPSRFLEGGELVLTTGGAIPRDTDPEDERSVRQVAHEFVSRLSGIGVCGIGFGVKVHHDEAPDSLLAACRRHEMPLLVVPLEVPFVAITKAISRGLMDDELERLNRGYHSQRRLIAAAGSPGATRAIVLRTAELVGGWTALLDAQGRAIEVSHVSVERLVEASLPARRDAPAKATFASVNDIDVASFPLFGPSGRLLGHLVAGRRGHVGALDHNLVAVATTLLVLSMNRNARADRLIRHVRAAGIHELFGRGPAAVHSLVPEIWESLPAEPFRVLRASGPAAALTTLHEDLEPFDRTRPRGGAEIAFGDADDALWILAGSAQAAALAERLVTLDPRVTIGVSGPAWWDTLARSRREALSAASIASGAERRTRWMRFEEAQSTSMLGLLTDDRAQAFAAAHLGPLLTPAAERSDLLGTVACWLRNTGRLDPTARELGIHRHTLTKRLERAEQLLGRPLSSPDVRAELWFALRVRHSDHDLVAATEVATEVMDAGGH